MEKKKFIPKLKDYYWLIEALLVILFGFLSIIWSFFKLYKDTSETIDTTKQMALKSVIWNESIPEVERISACDIYLESGYNSVTKKHCETIINRSDF